MKIYSIAVCFIHLFGMAIAQPELLVDVKEKEDIGINLEKEDSMEEVGLTESPVELQKETLKQSYIRGSVAMKDDENQTKRDLAVAKGGTLIAARGSAYIVAKGGTYNADKGANAIPVEIQFYVDTPQKKKPRRYYGKGKGKGGGYYGGYGSYYDSYGYSGYGGGYGY
jgi:hypothetical protein